MRMQRLAGIYGCVLMLGMAGAVLAQDGAPAPQAQQQMQGIHGPRSIDQELSHLTKDLELTADQQKQVRVLLQQHHDKIQALFDQNPSASRQSLGPQIHAISDETHQQIHELLNDHQKELEQKMREREHGGHENRESAPVESAPPDPTLSLA